MYIVDPEDVTKLMLDGEQGEICIGGCQVRRECNNKTRRNAQNRIEKENTPRQQDFMHTPIYEAAPQMSLKKANSGRHPATHPLATQPRPPLIHPIAPWQVAYGYVARPELTRINFVPNPHGAAGLMYRTGDLGSRDPFTGWLTCTGRADRQVRARTTPLYYWRRVEPWCYY
jgi:non-ribosomal peptide synthetase component F